MSRGPVLRMVDWAKGEQDEWLLLIGCVGSMWQLLLGIPVSPGRDGTNRTMLAACQLQDRCHSPHP